MLCEHGNSTECALVQSCDERHVTFLTAKIVIFSLHHEAKPYAVWNGSSIDSNRLLALCEHGNIKK